MGGFHEVEILDFSMKHQSGGFDEPTWGEVMGISSSQMWDCVLFFLGHDAEGSRYSNQEPFVEGHSTPRNMEVRSFWLLGTH